MTKIAIIHTTPATIDPLGTLAREIIPDCGVVNFVDDSILGQLLESEGDLSLVEDRCIAYACFAQEVNSDIILVACSSIGELAKKMQASVSIPVVRIDDPMTDVVVEQATRIGVSATMSTTLKPTKNLLLEKAEKKRKSINLQSVLVEGAFDLLVKGDHEGHDNLLIETLGDLADKVDVVVLAQASMARVVTNLPDQLQHKFYTSPRMAMESIRKLSNTIDQKSS